jgi:diguanylate cyclase (GGDEF)-like protein/PAS domain S-box-containing protein
MICIYDPVDGRGIYCNREIESVLGYTSEQIQALGHDLLRQLVHPDDRGRLIEGEERLRALAQGRTLEVEYRMRHADTGWRWLLGRDAAFARDAEGRVTQVIGAAVDITARKAAEERIEHLALHDALTGLPNRALLLDRLGHALARARRAGTGIAVLALDLDGFKDVNDSFGHEAGDRLLHAVAERIGGLIRASDTLARVGGDEFVLVQGDVPGPEAATALARKVLAGLAAPFDVGGQEAHASASLGIALYPGDGHGPSELLRGADLALYRAKQEGRRRYRLFDPAMDAEARTRRQVEQELRRALEFGELTLYYQPQLDLASGRFTAVEALVRWNHPKRGLVFPGEFVPVAEASGLIHQLGAWVLREACRQAQAWREEGLALAMAVNLSPAQLRHPEGLGAVDEALGASGLDPRLLELEITEGLLVELGGGATGEHLTGLVGRGVRLAIDDFGTGYSSLAYLKRLPVQRIKIDRSFVRGIGTDPEDEAVVQAIVGLGHALGKAVVAEGVESEAQLGFLRRLRCDAAQGFLLSRPQPVEKLGSTLGIRSERAATAPPVDARGVA